MLNIINFLFLSKLILKNFFEIDFKKKLANKNLNSIVLVSN